MNNQPQSLISYGEKVQYGLVQKNEREMRKNATNEFDENDPISLKSLEYWSTIVLFATKVCSSSNIML